MHRAKTSFTYIPKSAITYALIFIVCVAVGSPRTSDAQLPLALENGSYQSPFAIIYEKVSPSVVRINVSSDGGESESRNPWDYFGNRDDSENNRPVHGMGSGVIIDREGHIVTNDHVITGAENIEVKVNVNEIYEAEVIGTDQDTDIAVIRLKLDGKLLPASYVAELGNSDTLKPGDYAIAIGNPIGLDRTINVGVISALNRHDFQIYGSQAPLYQNYIQTDAQINPGNSGGALVDISGNVIGINNMYTARFAGIGFAIPINLVKSIVPDLIEQGEVKRGFVGLNGVDLTNEDREKNNLESTEGLKIVSITKDYPADKAGLKVDDILISIDGVNIENYNDFRFKIAEYNPGDTVRFEVVTDGEKRMVAMQLADRTLYFASIGELQSADSWRGIHVVNIDRPVKDKYDLGDINKGIVVVSIDEDSPAANKVNLREGDVIIEIERKEVNNVQDFRKIKQKYNNDEELSDRTILIYRHRLNSNGRSTTGYVAVKSK